MINTTIQLARNEARTLRPYAVLSKNSRGRKYNESLDPQRLPFQKDRDRIIHCRAFRRLKEKTQVFVPHYGDHYRNRLTHTLEVAQISRDVARTLGLNEDLVEAIALAHDLGHTPFGHAGEIALDECLRPYGMSFEHNEQSRRIVEELERVYSNFSGLNLSLEVIEGLMKHQTSWDNPQGVETIRPSLEAQVVNFADEIAYQNHDIDDGLRSGLFTEKDLEELELCRSACEASLREDGIIADDKIRVARRVSKMIGIMIWDLADESSNRIEKYKIKNLRDVYKCKESLIGFSTGMVKANKELKGFLERRLYAHPEVKANLEHGQETIRKIFAERIKHEEPALVRDYLAGMTDRFAELEVQSF